MGRKYASIHIYGSEQEKNLLILKDFYSNDKSVDMIRKKALSIISDPEVRRMIERQFELSMPDILIIQSKNVISVYDENISFESIEERAKAISENINNPVIYTSNFDDDVFVFGIYQSGKLVTCKNAGKGLSTYDISPVTLDLDKFCYILSLEKTASVELLNISEEVEILKDEMNNILNVPFKLSTDDIYDDYGQYTEIFTEKRVHVFKRK